MCFNTKNTKENSRTHFWVRKQPEVYKLPVLRNKTDEKIKFQNIIENINK
jgi:hypothetical protein